MGCDAQQHGVAPGHTRPGQRHPHAGRPAQPGQGEGCAHVREQPDRRFRHREHSPLRRDPDGAVDAKADAAAHADAVNEGHERLGVAGDGKIERVFGAEKMFDHIVLPIQHCLPNRAHVTTRTEGLAARAVQYDRMDGWVVPVGGQRRRQRPDHLGRQRIESARPVESDPGHPPPADGAGGWVRCRTYRRPRFRQAASLARSIAAVLGGLPSLQTL